MYLGDIVSLSDALRNLGKLQAYQTGGTSGTTQGDLDRIRDEALKATSAWIRDSLIKARIARPWPPSADAYQPPATRRSPEGSGSLLTSISDMQKGNTSLIYVDTSKDRSKGKRLSKYMKYLESGWVIGGRPGVKRKLKKGRDGNVPTKLRNRGISVPGRVQPPRYYMKIPFIRNEIPWIKAKYRRELRRRLPSELKYLADNAPLDVQYVPPNVSVTF
jgi:hypothetical protein